MDATQFDEVDAAHASGRPALRASSVLPNCPANKKTSRAKACNGATSSGTCGSQPKPSRWYRTGVPISEKARDCQS